MILPSLQGKFGRTIKNQVVMSTVFAQRYFDQSAFSGRLTIAQRFIAGKAMGFATKVRETDD
jgi:hypothetical protein